MSLKKSEAAMMLKYFHFEKDDLNFLWKFKSKKSSIQEE